MVDAERDGWRGGGQGEGSGKKSKSFWKTFKEGGMMRAGFAIALVFFSSFYSFYHVNSSGAAESGYPTKPIEIFVGMAAGGSTDLAARMLAENSKKYFGQEVVVVNKPGGTGIVAVTLVSKAKPDGYTLGAASDVSITLEPHRQETPYKLEDFTFVSEYGVLEYGYAVLPGSSFRGIKDLVEFARANPYKLTVSTPGAGGFSQMVWEALALLEGVKIKVIPFSGATPAITALLGGHVMVASNAINTSAPYLKAKKIRLLAVGSAERMDTLPEVPTLKELGYPSLVFRSLYIITGPKNLEEPIVKKMAQVFRSAMECPSYIKLAKDLDMYEKNPLVGNELKDAMIRQSKNNQELLKKLGMGSKQ